MTLATMKNNLLRFVPGMNPDIIESTIQDAYRQLCLKDWNKLRIASQINTIPLYSTGTISVDTSGNVTGVLTNFTSAMVGRHLHVHYSDAIFEILTVGGPTSLVLANWTGETVTSEAYYIMKIIYTISTDIGIVYDVTYQTSLKKKSQYYFNRFDPSRLTTGTAEWWAFAGLDPTTQALRIEIYPVPYEVEPLRIYGKKKIVPLNDSTPVYALLSEDLIEAYSLLMCYNIKDSQDPKAGWGDRITTQKTYYETLLTAAWDEDYEIGAHESKVRDAMGEFPYPVSNDYLAQHDVE